MFSAQQRKQFQAGVKAGLSPRQAFSILNFTPQPQQQLRQIIASSQQQMEGILTAQQKQQYQQYQQYLQSRQNPRPAQTTPSVTPSLAIPIPPPKPIEINTTPAVPR